MKLVKEILVKASYFPRKEWLAFFIVFFIAFMISIGIDRVLN